MDNLRRYVATATRIDGAPWPARAVKCRDDYDQSFSVIDSTVVAARLRDVGESDIMTSSMGFDPVERAIWMGTSAVLYTRSTSATTYVVALVSPWDEEAGEYAGDTEVYYGSAGGYGYDRLAAAAAGIPIGTAFAPGGKRHRVITTDHSGLFTMDHPWREEDERGNGAFLVHRSGYLPRGLFVR